MKKPPVTFHVGLIKTGTSWLKSHVFSRMKGISYFAADESFRDFIDQIDPSLPMLVSNEDLSGRKPFAGDYRRARLRALQNLADIFPESRLLIFFREPSLWLTSLYRQYILEGGCDAWSSFSARWLQSGALDFDDLLTKIRSMNFSKILALDHADLVEHQSQTLSVVSDFVGCDNLDMSEFDRNTRRKVGVRNNAAKILLLMNRNQIIGARDIIRKWPFRLLNGYGDDIFPLQDLGEIKELYRDMWQRVRGSYLTDPVVSFQSEHSCHSRPNSTEQIASGPARCDQIVDDQLWLRSS